MKSRILKTQIDADGVLRLEVPFSSAEAAQRVQVTVEPEEPGNRRQWSPNFFTEVAGQWEGEFVRPDQGTLREPEAWA